ncbi:MAG: hypothetical protein N3D74_06520, partial [Caldisericia bacterium]|nr:hypothetical protein [Caldisericia bacterium]
DTLRKFIINLNFEFENNTPKEILNEILRIKLLDSFEKGISFLKNINLNQGKKLIIATYISLFDRDINFKTLTRKDVLQKIFYLFENDYEEFSNYLKSNT